MKRERQALTAIVTDNSDTWPRERRIEITGRRYCEALRALVDAGDRGITALEVSSWALRLASYVHHLKTHYGIDIETRREPHDGGKHGRYFLRSKVTVLPGDALPPFERLPEFIPSKTKVRT